MRYIEDNRDEQSHCLMRSGRRNLRLMAMLFLFYYIIYGALSILLLQELFPLRYAAEQKAYFFRLLIEGGIWLFIMLLLWKGKRFGRGLFALTSLLSLYACIHLPALFDVTMQGWESQAMRILFTALFISKYLILFSCLVRMYKDPFIRGLWSHQKVALSAEEAEVRSEEEEDAAARMVLQEALLVQVEEDGRLTRRAQRFLHRYTFLLVSIAFGTMILYLLALFLLQAIYPNDVDGLQYVQRILLLATLFSALIWSFVGVAMFLYSDVALLLLPIVWLLEIVRLINQLPELWTTFQTQQYQLPSILTLIVLEVLRYGLFIRLSLRIYRNPFLRTYWKSERVKKKRRSQD